MTTGALVTANQASALATIQQLDPVYVDVTQSTAELLPCARTWPSGLMKNGESAQAQVKLLLEDGTPYPLTGNVEILRGDGRSGDRLRTLCAPSSPIPSLLLMPGMFVRAVLEEGRNEQAILVPQRGVTRNPAGNAMVMVVGAEEKVEPRVIKVARTVGDSWLVNEGLKAGDRVILEGMQKARAGTVVKAVPFGAAPAAPAPAPAPPGAAAPEKK